MSLLYLEGNITPFDSRFQLHEDIPALSTSDARALAQGLLRYHKLLVRLEPFLTLPGLSPTGPQICFEFSATFPFSLR